MLFASVLAQKLSVQLPLDNYFMSAVIPTACHLTGEQNLTPSVGLILIPMKDVGA